MSAIFLNDNSIILCTDNHLTLYKPSLYDSPICQFNEGPYVFATSFNGLVAAVASNNNAAPPLTQFFLLLYQEKSTNSYMKSIEFPSKILGLISTSTHLYVSISKTIQVFDLKSLNSISTLNPTSSSGYFVASDEFIVWPDDLKPGRVFLSTVSDFKVKHKIDCHSSEINTMIFSKNLNSGNFLVTSSKKGTLIRLFDCLDGHLVTEFRRGYTQGNIIDIDMKFGILCACTASTIHVFVRSFDSKEENNQENGASHSRSLLSTVLSFVPSLTKNGGTNENSNVNENQDVHLTITPNGVPLACSINEDKSIFVVSNNEHLFIYEIIDNCKSLSLKQAHPLTIFK